ncbi:FG-GAP repeat protein [Enhygromyxa salina]|uniref:FG-GAP repeat protein n=1 Tax=Enhygromyxa salina TaxID=215803 RepID=A0A2S9Y4G4_9BACT|nr:FG-GAP-like repeat-containing protein [Enhygromyxa salina]PRP99984.1 FG-GAP repeat protein [Enhygromyxa salina]
MRRSCLASAFVLPCLAPWVLACSDNGNAEGDTEVGITQGTEESGSSESGESGETDGEEAGETVGDPDLPPECEPACEDQQQCIDGACCDEAAICAGVCCAGEEVCSFSECVIPGDECIDATECPEGDYCEYSLGESGGAMDMCQGGSVATGKCLPSPPDCPPGERPEPDEELTCLPVCEYMPETNFAPELKFQVPDLHVMMSPIVTQLDDDNCDGLVDERDIPEIVFSSFFEGDYNSNGTLHAVSIVDGQLVDKWSANPQAPQIHPGVELTAGDVGGMPGSEIFVCTNTGQVRAFNPDGSELWISSYTGGCLMPSLADLDHDGQVELVVKGGVLDAATGATEATFGITQVTVQPIDLDGDGTLEIAGPQAVYEADGTLLGMTGVTGSWTAAADLDLDFNPEIIVAEFSSHRVHIYHWDQQTEQIVLDRQNFDINGPLSPDLCPPGSSGNTRGGGPPTVADFNGDGTPDVAIAGGVGYAVLDGTKIMDPMVADVDAFLWISQTHDCSSAQTGSSVFDFDGDGSAEVVYSDERYLRIYRGTDGEVLWQTCNTTGTLRELPVVADVDNDGHADIVVVSNDYSSITCEDTKQTGVRVFGDEQGKWVRTRRIWNQHHYHVTNINEDGSVPTQEMANWLSEGLNNFRQNVQPQGEFSAPDLVVDIQTRCLGGYEVVARVRNIGQASVPAGVKVGFYDGDPAMGGSLIGQGVTTKVLYPAEAEDVVLDGDLVPQAIKDGDQELWVVVDDGMPEHPWHECRTDNNVHHEDAACEVIG